MKKSIKLLENFKKKFFTDIVGFDSVKEELFQFCDMILNPYVYRKLHVRIPHGILLYGAPGCGKTTIAQELANICADKVYFIDGAMCDDILQNEILEKLKEASDSEGRFVILIDNLDKFCARDVNSPVYDTLSDLMQTFINEDNEECFFIATSGEIESLPYGLMRKNTFEYTIHVDTPTYEDTKKLVQYFAKIYPVASNVNLDDIDKLFFNESCAYIIKVFDTAGKIAGGDRRFEITTEDFVIAHIVEQGYAVFDGEPNETSAWHEAGHLVVCELMTPGCVSIAYVSNGDYSDSVVSRWQSLPANQLVISALAGKAACEIQFGKKAEGTSSDLNKARNYLFDLMYKSGSYGFLGLEATSGVHDSENSTFERETIVRAELQRNLFKAQTMLAQNREFLEKTANALMQKSYLLHSDIEEIKKNCTIHPIEGV